LPNGYLLNAAEEARTGRPLPGSTRPTNFGPLIIGGIFVSIALVLGYWSNQKLTEYKRTSGSVVGLTRGRKGGTHPVVNYLVAGQKYTMKGASSSGMFGGGYQIGDRVEVLYPPEQPSNATINRFSDLWLGPTICGVLGGACLLLWLMAQAGTGIPTSQRSLSF
jgi:hypothetical protein